MLQSNVFSAYNYEWLNQQTLEKTTQFCGPSMQGFNLDLDSKFCLPSCQLKVLPIAFSTELPKRK